MQETTGDIGGRKGQRRGQRGQTPGTTGDNAADGSCGGWGRSALWRIENELFGIDGLKSQNT